jgi:hypothetical protein
MREPVTCTCAERATLVMRVSGAKRHSPHSFSGRSRPRKDVLVPAPGALGILRRCRKTTRAEQQSVTAPINRHHPRLFSGKIGQVRYSSKGLNGRVKAGLR